jgi:hypothetical protein
MTEGLLLATKPAGIEDPEDDPVETIVQQLERDWSVMYPLQGTWFNGPDCLEAIDEQEESEVSASDLRGIEAA